MQTIIDWTRSVIIFAAEFYGLKMSVLLFETRGNIPPLLQHDCCTTDFEEMYQRLNFYLGCYLRWRRRREHTSHCNLGVQDPNLGHGIAIQAIVSMAVNIVHIVKIGSPAGNKLFLNNLIGSAGRQPTKHFSLFCNRDCVTVIFVCCEFFVHHLLLR